MHHPAVRTKSIGSSSRSSESSIKSESVYRRAETIPMATDPSITDIQHLTTPGLLHAQRLSPKEDVRGAWQKSHQVSDDWTWLPDYRTYDDAELEEDEEAKEEEGSDQEECDAAGFVALPEKKYAEPKMKTQTGFFTDFEHVDIHYSGAQPEELEKEEPEALAESVYKWGGAIGTWANNARSRVDANAQGCGGHRCQGPHSQPQRLAGGFANNLCEATQQRRPTRVAFHSQLIRKPQYDFKHPRGCTPGILKPSVIRPPSDESPAQGKAFPLSKIGSGCVQRMEKDS